MIYLINMGMDPSLSFTIDGECAEGQRLKAGNGRGDEGGRCAGLVYLVV